jgi:hypothetical protein
MVQVLIEWGTARHVVPTLVSACSDRADSRVTGYAQPDVASCFQGSERARRGARQDDGPVGLHHTCTLATLHQQPAQAEERRCLGPHTQVLPPRWQGGRGTSMQRQRHSRSWTPSGRAWDSAEASRQAARPATQRRCAMLCGVVLVLVTGRCRGWAGHPGGHAIAARGSHCCLIHSVSPFSGRCLWTSQDTTSSAQEHSCLLGPLSRRPSAKVWPCTHSSKPQVLRAQA